MGDPVHTRNEGRPLPPILDAVKERAIDELHRRLADEGYGEIRPGHGCVFRFVDPQGSRLTDLAQRAGMSKQAVGEVVADLERMGYVERVPDPRDRRAKIIRLTKRGWAAEETALSIFDDIERRWAEQVGAERMALLREVLEDLLADEATSPTARLGS